MAAPTIDTTFISQFESEVHVAFQRMGSKLRNTVREKKVSAQDDTFPKIGKGVAGQKARHGKVPLMNLGHSKVQVTMADYYAGEIVDKLDMLKTNIDERQVTVQAIAGALGRKVDEVLVTAMDAATNDSESSSGGLTLAKVQNVHTRMGNRDVPDDGARFWPVSPAGWNDLISIDQFLMLIILVQNSFLGLQVLQLNAGLVSCIGHSLVLMQTEVVYAKVLLTIGLQLDLA